MKLTKLFAVLALVLTTATANAAVIGFDTEQTVVPNGTGDGSIDGYIANDLLIDFEGQLTGQQLIIRLDSGSIYNDGNGTDVPPNPGFFGLAPTLEYDSFVAIGGLDNDTTEDILVAGAAVNIEPGSRAATFDSETLVDIAWAPAPGIVIADRAAFPIARITLSPDANGVARVFSSTGDVGSGGPFSKDFVITGGVIVPEPASMALAGFAVLGMAAIRRR